MRIKFKSAATALTLCLVLQAQAETLLGKVIHVQDGDSITVLDDTRTQHKIRLTGIDADIRTGTQRDAVLYSWGANDKHGLPRSNADKRHIVTVILKDEQGRQWSDNKIAKDFGFSHPFVGNVRRSLETVSSEKSAERTYTTKLGLWRDAAPLPPWHFRRNGKP